MEVVTFKEVGIGTITMESRVICRGDSFMEDYIYNRWSRSLAKNIFWEEGKTSFLIYFVDSKINHKGGRSHPLLHPLPKPRYNAVSCFSKNL